MSEPSNAVPARADDPALPLRSKLFLLIGVAALAAMAVLAIGLIANILSSDPAATADRAADAGSSSSSQLSFVGTETCIGCHQEAGNLWRPSQHAHAMAHATADTVLGDFSGATFDYYGTTSRFFTKDGKFFVETDGADGGLETFEVKYTFGLDPLQQYLIEFPDGRVQALTIAWDSRPKADGGQRWFHLYPDEKIGHDDPLHWTKLNQNWNFMCAECHSTGVAKNYDPTTKRYHTTWKEITVGCEACHGEGSAHVAWAEEGAKKSPDDNELGLLARFDERKGVSWTLDPKTKQPQRSAPPMSVRKEVEMCGRCHARRGILSEVFVPGQPLSDSHQVALISRGLFQADGQMLDEVYNYGQFKQSKMFAAGVTCSDCHDPHSAKLRAPGAEVCTQCHAGSYAQPSHTHHEGADSPNCISCHMPSREFMVIDTRHDHSFRVPRPDLSVTLGVDNACTDCHTDKTAAWAAEAIEDWYGLERKGYQTFGPAFHAAWTGAPDAAALLAAVAEDDAVPAFVRASAVEELTAYPSERTADMVRKGLSDPDPLVRLAALDHLETASGEQLWPLIAPLLDDPVRGVRNGAGFLLAGTPEANLSEADRLRLNKAEKGFVAAQMLNADRPESQSLLARYYIRKGELDKAEQAYKRALELSPHFTPGAVNLADLYRAQGRDEEGIAVLREALRLSPNDGGLHHALGLALVRQKMSDEAIAELARAAELEPDRVRYTYVYAVGLNSVGRRVEAIAALKAGLERHPQNADILTALVNYSRAEGDLKGALLYAQRLAKADPANPEVKSLVEALTKQIMEQRSAQ
ncbi:tetratricopeptide repeat protein [Methyloceanibacter caenitepidi]|uniref:Probable deca-heme c-type cytochrome n=1 Tax=Methyloceanibacter caenitepidi TaxID=1384459 RepID=A0A0A8K0A6_9HYPH|nr:tetratricopeptide repeat protein [Methyloceanibacter caenitepidi]BAQ16388.1 probable deca-heme c-type cytochrome [Methyloceanibacter caenitepidi]